MSAASSASSAEVGSSATIVSGSPARAAAIAARCAMPPDSSWGYNRSASGSSRARRHSSTASCVPPRMPITSSSWAPTLRTGVKEVATD